MGNINFSDNATFSWYVVLLILSGAAMVIIGALFARSQLSRLLNVVFGIGFVGYGVYLGWVFHGGTYVIFFKAFIQPVVMIYSAVRGGLRRRQAPQATVVTPQPTASVEGAPTPPAE